MGFRPPQAALTSANNIWAGKCFGVLSQSYRRERARLTPKLVKNTAMRVLQKRISLLLATICGPLLGHKLDEMPRIQGDNHQKNTADNERRRECFRSIVVNLLSSGLQGRAFS